nr:MAG TPA: hypothetical protein [Caudoviricetes sp.]
MQVTGNGLVVCRLGLGGSNPSFPIPVNCHYRKAFPKCSHLPSDWFRWFTLGDDAWFKSTRRTFLFLRGLYGERLLLYMQMVRTGRRCLL